MNLLKETIEELKRNGKAPSDVIWIGSENYWSDWENFEYGANVEYDDGYGAPEVAENLLIVGKDWWLERHEYDGSEWWEFKQMPKKPKTKVVFSTFIGGMWNSLEELNGLK